MQQSGEVPEPQQPAAQPASPLPPPTGHAANDEPVEHEDGDGPGGPDEPPGPEGRGFLIAGILALVLVIGAVAWMARPDDGLAEVERNEERFPTPTTLPPPTTVPLSVPASSVGATPVPTTAAAVATTPAPVTAPVTTPAPTPPPTPPPTPAPTVAPTPTTDTPVVPPGPTEPGATTVPLPDDPDHVATLVPSVAGFAEHLSTPELVATQVEELLADPRHDIAVPGPVATICAVVPMDEPLAVRGRWEHDGRRVASSDLERRDAPGFGECLTNDGDPLEDGSYQYIGADSNGNESAAGGIVVGAVRLEQELRNDGDVDICAVRIAPSSSRYFEAYVFGATPIAPGTTITLPVADVEQDVETVDCDDVEVASFSFQPDAGTVQSLAP